MKHWLVFVGIPGSWIMIISPILSSRTPYTLQLDMLWEISLLFLGESSINKPFSIAMPDYIPGLQRVIINQQGSAATAQVWS